MSARGKRQRPHKDAEGITAKQVFDQLKRNNEKQLQRWTFQGECTSSGGQAKVCIVKDESNVEGVFRCLADTHEHPRRDREMQARNRFEREIKILNELSSLEHPGILKLMSCCERKAIDDGPFWYVAKKETPLKEYWESCREKFRQDPETLVAEAINLVDKIADSMAVFHGRTPPFVHRDVKHDNIIVVSETGQPILIDFGVAYAPGYRRLTRVDEVVSNRGFSHDVARRHVEEPTPWFDVFQLSQVMLWLVDQQYLRWERPIHWRYARFIGGLTLATEDRIRALAAACSIEEMSPKNGAEFQSLLRTLFPKESMKIEQDNPMSLMDRIAPVLLDNKAREIQQVALDREMEAVAIAMTSPIGDELYSGIRDMVNQYTKSLDLVAEGFVDKRPIQLTCEYVIHSGQHDKHLSFSVYMHRGFLPASVWPDIQRNDEEGRWHYRMIVNGHACSIFWNISWSYKGRSIHGESGLGHVAQILFGFDGTLLIAIDNGEQLEFQCPDKVSCVLDVLNSALNLESDAEWVKHAIESL